MAPNVEKNTTNTDPRNRNIQKPSRLSVEGLQRTISDISYELTKEAISYNQTTTDTTTLTSLTPISEVEDAKCECCGMSEECTPEYIHRVRAKFSGKLICGLCAEAVNEEMEKKGDVKCSREEALHAHMTACAKFNRLGRSHPLLYQAEAVREILKKSSKARATSISPKKNGAGPQIKGGIARSSSCMPAIMNEVGGPAMAN